MFRVDVPTAAVALPAPSAPGTPGYFSNGNPGLGVPRTILEQDYMNMVQEELMAVVVAGGLTPSKSTYTQVRDAIRQLAISSSIFPDLVTGDQSPVQANNHYAYITTNAATYTLPHSTTLSNLWTIAIHAYGGAVTVHPNASDTLNGAHADIVIPKGYSGRVYTDFIGGMYLVGDFVNLVASVANGYLPPEPNLAGHGSDATASTLNEGFQILPDGMVRRMVYMQCADDAGVLGANTATWTYLTGAQVIGGTTYQFPGAFSKIVRKGFAPELYNAGQTTSTQLNAILWPDAPGFSSWRMRTRNTGTPGTQSWWQLWVEGYL